MNTYTLRGEFLAIIQAEDEDTAREMLEQQLGEVVMEFSVSN